MSPEINIESSWREKLDAEFKSSYFKELTDFVRNEYENAIIYPAGKNIFRAFDKCPFEKVKVVIVGQDPYHGKGQANGLCFSVNEDVAIPPSLLNIFKEIKNDLGIEIPTNGNLERWANQGVLLLNATLTVRASSPGSHQNKGWEVFTDAVIKKLSSEKKHLVFMLWGAYAQKKGKIIDTKNQLVLTSPHPSPFSVDRGFFGCNHFSKANAYLTSNNFGEIEW